MSLRDAVVWHPTMLPPSGLPERFLDATPSGIGNAAIRAVVDRYLAAFWREASAGIAPAFFGKPGEWKTYGAAVIVRYALSQRLPVAFVECGPWFLRADALFYAVEGPRMLDDLARAPFVVLDDVTQVQPSTRAAELMANVLAVRFGAQRPTLVTGNAPMRAAEDLRRFGELYRADFARRLRHGSTGYWAAV
ncbi:MAG TPA: hypothetical protein VNC22_08400 [Sporichthya sp.]|nr:hypothetical protein [Sporichthya sp.]